VALNCFILIDFIFKKLSKITELIIIFKYIIMIKKYIFKYLLLAKVMECDYTPVL